MDRLFTKLESDLGHRGVRAVGMLKTAALLLESQLDAPHLGESVAYCDREAVVGILQATDAGGERWRTVSRRIVAEKQRFDLAAGFPEQGEALRDLLSAVDDLKQIHSGRSVHQERLAALIKVQTGLDPLPGENSLLDQYQRLIDDLNGVVHASPQRPPVDLGVVRELHGRALDVLVRIFDVDNRLDQIAKLAVLATPTDKDADRLVGLLQTHHDLRFFATRVDSPGWLPLLTDRGVLDPPGDGAQLVQTMVRRLKEAHLDALVDWTGAAWVRWSRDDRGLVVLGAVGWELGERGIDLLVRALRKNPSLRMLCDFGMLVIMDTEAADPSFVELADVLLNPDAATDDHYKKNDIPRRLVEGMDTATAASRSQMLVYKLSGYLTSEKQLFILPTGSISDVDQGTLLGVAGGLISILARALEKARSLGTPTSDLLTIVDPLPEPVRSRFVAWLYSGAEDVDCSELIEFVVLGIGGRRPTGDDAFLLDRIERDCDSALVAGLWEALGDAPDPEALSND